MNELFRLYQKIGGIDFDEFWVTDSEVNEGTNCLVNELIGVGRIVRCALSHNEGHKTRNGWYSGMAVPIYSIVGILIKMYYIGLPWNFYFQIFTLCIDVIALENGMLVLP